MAKNSYLDVVGKWSEVKLEILQKYASAYSKIVSPRFTHYYIDGFAGAGVHVSKERDELIQGSPLRALEVQPPFKRYFFVDLSEERVGGLKQLIGDRQHVEVLQGDCNDILVNQILPQVRYEQYRRALCILDPYGLDLDWAVIEAVGKSKSIDLFLNFPVMDMNRNAIRKDRDAASEKHVERMNKFWGDESWRTIMYSTTENLFGIPEKQSNEVLANAFAERLKTVAGFGWVPTPMPMRNSRDAIVYYLFFASQKELAEGIVKDIFRKYQ